MFSRRVFGLLLLLCLCIVINAAKLDSSRTVHSYRPESEETAENTDKPEKIEDDVIAGGASAGNKKSAEKYVKAQAAHEKTLVIDKNLNPALEGASDALRNVLG